MCMYVYMYMYMYIRDRVICISLSDPGECMREVLGHGMLSLSLSLCTCMYVYMYVCVWLSTSESWFVTECACSILSLFSFSLCLYVCLSCQSLSRSLLDIWICMYQPRRVEWRGAWRWNAPAVAQGLELSIGVKARSFGLQPDVYR